MERIEGNGTPSLVGLSLLLQHERLLQALDEIEDRIERIRVTRATSPTEPPWNVGLLAVVEPFVERLATHFEIESRSTASAFRGELDRAKYEALRELDREHPELHLRFRVLVARLKRAACYRSERERMLSELEEAILAFRVHERREDELFDS